MNLPSRIAACWMLATWASVVSPNVQAQHALPPQAMRPATELALPAGPVAPVSYEAPAATTTAPDTSGGAAGVWRLPPVGARALFAAPIAPPAEAAPTAAVGPSAAPGALSDEIVVPPFVPADVSRQPLATTPTLGEPWSWRVLPSGLIYKSYLAGVKEPRLGTQIVWEPDEGWLWDVSLGGRVGLLRYGTSDELHPDGWQLDVEGAAFPRLNPSENLDLEVVDFRAGMPLTYGRGPWRAKLAFYHLSSHFGDEFLFRTGTTTRINYSRDAVVLGQSYFVTPDVRLYAEAEFAVQHDEHEPWAFQFGVEFSPERPSGPRGDPFLAVGGHLREELDFSGNLVVQAGWQWRGNAGHLLRLGMHYYNGLSPQFEIFRQFEQQIGAGVWYDF